MKQQIVDHGDPRRYWTQVPNIVFDIGLNYQELTLYLHLRRTAGASSRCFKSVRTLSKECGMSPTIIVRAKATLQRPRKELTNKPLISVIERQNPNGGKPFHEIRLTDIWKENTDRYSPLEQVPNMELEVGRQVPREAGASAINEPSQVPDMERKKNSKKNIEEEQRGDFLSELKAKPLYARLDLDTELAKAETWAAANHKRVTPRFFVNWINRSLEHLPLNGNGNGSAAHDAAWHARQAELARRAGRVYRPDAS